jgi:hypothetical protein
MTPGQFHGMHIPGQDIVKGYLRAQLRTAKVDYLTTPAEVMIRLMRQQRQFF